MRHVVRTRLLAGVLLLAAAGCAATGPAALRPVDAAAPEPALARARAAADSLTRGLAGLLLSTLDAEGPVAALRVCSEVAQSVTAGYADEGLTVRRVGTRLRNPANRPDARESAALARFAAAMAAGQPPGEVTEVLEAPDGARTLAVVRPIVLQPRCVTCHGPREGLDPGVTALLRERYPADAAVGYAAGELRGAVSVRVAIGR